ncbi:MFS transporter [Pseudoxanthomonas sp. PXM02]|uniref:AmpG family muropeptide MFS transporter n=1 Tax=Pseudoxanthomonas sp. PXM02 TaxID=2769294 RepID=UPI001784E228|nr:MFS transporter [Pseudoxanthomonas sp. PXM02]MBD9480252.1 MFS transporter [Pseudoxanthomonas sp. PXM02]
MTSSAAPPSRKPWQNVLLNLRQPKVLAMLLLGFSSGLPLYLVGNTMGYWMRENGSELSAIGFLSWVGLAYTLKFLWAPIIDKTDVPLLGRLGRRRGWMLLSQIVVAGGLAGMAIVQPQGGLVTFAVLALIAAFASATQDIVIDAWRIEIANNTEELGLLTSGTQFGYRTALLVTDALILILATYVGWAMSYWMMAALMGVGMFSALFLAREPAATQLASATHSESLWTLSGLWDAIIGPFIAFFRAHGKWALLMLAAISLYRLPDFVMGPMNNPFYADIGLSKEFVGEVRASVGLISSLIGIAAAGISAVRFGFAPTLLAGAILGPGSNAAFSWVAYTHGDPTVFVSAMAIDGFATGFAGTALVAYMSSLTSIGYTATQYALLSSFYALLGKMLKGFSGVAVEYLAVGRTLIEGYALFFLGTALAGLPALLLCLWLARQLRARPSVAG